MSVKDKIFSRNKALNDLENQAYFEVLFESSPEAVVVINDDIKISRVNSAFTRIFGFSAEEAIGRFVDDLIVPEELYDEGRNITMLTQQGDHTGVETRRLRKDGTLVDVSILAMPIMLDDRQLGSFAIYRDITDKKQAEDQKKKLREQLIRAERMESLGLLAGGVAHDLNNILGPLVGYPEILKLKLPQDSPLISQVDKILDSALRAAEIVQDLLTLARRGRYDMNILDFNQVVGSYLESPDFNAIKDKYSEIKLVYNPDSGIPNICGSSPHLSKIVMNLIINAMDAMPYGGTLTVKTEYREIEKLKGGFDNIEKGKYVILSVSDTGVGIEPKNMKRLFEPFYSKKEMGRSSGSGLGLAIVYGVVKDHNGYIDVISEADRGSEFIVYIPVTDENARGEITQPPQLDIRGRETVLIVDDLEELRDLTSSILGNLGYNTVTVPNGQEAIDHLKCNKVDVIVLDMILEDRFDGLETYREIVKIAPDIPTIIVSGYSETDRVKEALRLGVYEFMKKPFTLQKLGKVIREAIDQKIKK